MRPLRYVPLVVLVRGAELRSPRLRRPVLLELAARADEIRERLEREIDPPTLELLVLRERLAAAKAKAKNLT